MNIPIVCYPSYLFLINIVLGKMHVINPPILVKSLRREDRDLILKNAFSLFKSYPNENKPFIGDDIPEEERSILKNMVELAKNLKKCEKLKAFVPSQLPSIIKYKPEDAPPEMKYKTLKYGESYVSPSGKVYKSNPAS